VPQKILRLKGFKMRMDSTTQHAKKEIF